SLTEASDKKEYEKAEEGIGASKPKKSFFKKKKPSVNKLEDTKKKESFEIVDEKPEIDSFEGDAIKLAEQHIKEIDKSKTKEDQTLGASFKSKLSIFKRKKKTFHKEPMDQKKIETDFKIDEYEMGLLDERIKESSNTTVSSEKIAECESNALKLAGKHIKDSDAGEEKPDQELVTPPDSKKSFFKKDKPPQETPSEPKEKEVKPDEPMIQPILRVENLPKSDEFSEDEKGILDEKIKESSEPVDTAEAENKAEAKAAMLAQEHLKDKDMPANKDESTETKKSKPEIEVPDLVPLAEADSEHEPVFFDEEESSSGGWSPQISDAGKKKMISDTTAEGEISFDDLAGVGDIELPKEVIKTKSIKLSDLGFSEKEWEELDFYSLYEPFSYVEILLEKESLDKCYFLVEMALSEEEEKILGFIEDTMACQDIDTVEFDEKDENEYLLEQLNEVIKEYNVEINEQSKNKIFYYMAKKALGLRKIDPLMKDPNVEDISCDGAGIPLFLYHRKYGSLKSNIRFNTEAELSSFVFKLAQKCGKHISIAEPMLDATMPDGSRIQMTLSDEITTKGSTFTIRKFGDNPFSPPDLVEFNTMSSEMIAYMWLAVENGINTLFAGGTASGKTTTLNALSLFIPRESKIVSIEETREVNLPHPNWIPGVSRSGFGEVVADKVVGEIDMYDLMK
ncbi:MAG: Flp pilus assembly complex ATPase component TadA, partial [Thermoplasmatales archaeon]|nr:Flp pilus assembly complex ATPase component TadA [Thermoplasmatales archaeon]